MTKNPLQDLEEKLAHLERMVIDLSDVVARQDQELNLMGNRIGLLMQRAAESEVAEGGTVPLADQRPPHY